MRNRLLTGVVTIAIASSIALPTAAQAAGRASTSTAACAAARVEMSVATVDDAADATLCLLNAERSRYGLKPLRLEARLGRAARDHSQDMVKKGYFQHESPDGRTPFQRMLATRYVPKGATWTLGENIGWGTQDLAEPAELVKAWMKSPGHRANILNGSFREIGIGIAIGLPMRPGAMNGQPGATYTTDFGTHS
jgi:uncharacterized protein YkwD